MDTIKDKYGNVFEIVDAVPEGFKVWNISKIDEAGEYLPLYEPLHPGDKNDYSVNTDTLKAIKLPAEMTARLTKAASLGVRTLEDAQKVLASKPRGNMGAIRLARASAAIKDFEDLWSR